MNSETIAAVATAMSPAGIGIVRISGDEAVAVADEVFRAKSKKKLAECASHTIHYGNICDGGSVVDEVLVLLMRAPHSYTAEDTVEIDCHGGVFVTRKVLEAVLSHGARMAEPGEFTKRAFLNGRIDLSQAEAVIDVINSQNDYALAGSESQLRGSLRDEVIHIREQVLHETAFIESALDDPEHISLDNYSESLHNTVETLLKSVDSMIASFDNGRIFREGIDTVIVGKPNVGKSSLLNILAGQERAIVTEVAGTTRDVLEEHIMLNGIPLNVMDTAGIRQTDDKVEKVGVERARKFAAKADLLIYVVDGSGQLDDDDFEIMDMLRGELRGKKTVVLLNKSDLEQAITENDIISRLNFSVPVISVSARENSGIDEFERTVTEMFFGGQLRFNDEGFAVNARQRSALADAREHLVLVERTIEDGVPEDFFTVDLMGAYEALGEVIGEEVGEELVEEIFSEFCIGK
ncbi:MAG: tRNA uridine-5-carboxymethylaminomethyl(34) synthesis GTPase MnmE [Clostridiales bacterium]|nr:tRNA uridine-5-carboxymethylaminomethyl(34) synthesis GTPase MnmE [Clostridiales bacterium]